MRSPSLVDLRHACDLLEAESIPYAVVGTFGLALRGYRTHEVPDIDILCERTPTGAEKAYNPESPGEPFLLDGVKVDYIDAEDEGRETYFHPETCDRIAGVMVAKVEDILGLKRWADREKDREFIAARPELAELLKG